MEKHNRTPRFTKRLEATFSAEDITCRGILSDISENGLFIRTNRGFSPGTSVDIELMMPDDQISKLSGVVRRTIKTPLSTLKNGIGVELTRKDAVFTDFLKSYLEEIGEGSHEKPLEEKGGEEAASPEFLMIACPSCGVMNKVSPKNVLLNPKCGKCKTPLSGA